MQYNSLFILSNGCLLEISIPVLSKVGDRRFSNGYMCNLLQTDCFSDTFESLVYIIFLCLEWEWIRYHRKIRKEKSFNIFQNIYKIWSNKNQFYWNWNNFTNWIIDQWFLMFSVSQTSLDSVRNFAVCGIFSLWLCKLLWYC